MADYWKSNPRKFCDACKCWFADNKSSIDFHERGKRHQEAVRQRLADLAKKGREDQIRDDQLDADMKHMEQAALAAFKKDVTQNPEMARQYGVTLGGKRKDAASTGAAPQDGVPLPTLSCEPNFKWHEAKSDQGYSYYWHVETGESVWEPPKEGYVPLSESAEKLDSKTPESSHSSKTGGLRDSNSASERVPTPKSELDEDPPPPGEVMGPVNRPVRVDPYGSKWETVQKEEPPEEASLELPQQRLPKPQPSVVREKPQIVFKQRTVGSLGASDSETFKRPAAHGAKKQRNIRQRTDD